MLSLWSWSNHLFWGRPGHRLQLGSASGQACPLEVWLHVQTVSCDDRRLDWVMDFVTGTVRVHGFHWRQPRRGCRGHIPSNILVGGRQWEYPHQYYYVTFGYSRPILVVLAQWHHLMMSFIDCFARKSKICHRIDTNPTEGAPDKKTLNLAPQNSPKYAILRQKKTKNLPPPRLLPRCGGGVSSGEGNTPFRSPTPSVLRPPNFELALTPLMVPATDH